MTHLFACSILCVAILTITSTDATPKAIPAVSIAVEPVSQPPVGTNIIVRCKGPLKNGAALIFDGDGKTEHGNPVVSFKMIQADGGAPNIQKEGGEAGRFTIFLDGDREGVKIKFRIRYTDNGFYRCAYFDSDTSSIKMQTDAILIQSFYPPEEPQLSYEEILRNDNYVVTVKCKGYVGYPPGKLALSVDGINNLEVGPPETTKAEGKMGHIWTVEATIPATLGFNGTLAKCVAGGMPNPVTMNATQILLVQVPVSQPKIKDTNVIFRAPGSRLECKAFGNPPPEYSWTLNHKQVNNSEPYLDVPVATGIYSATCKVTNEVLGKVFQSEYHFNFAVLPENMPCSDIRKEDSAHMAFVIATVLAVIFAIIALVVVVILIVTKRKSGYDKM